MIWKVLFGLCCVASLLGGLYLSTSSQKILVSISHVGPVATNKKVIWTNDFHMRYEIHVSVI